MAATSHEVGDLLQVNPSSVKKWVNDGRIAAFRTPGGHGASASPISSTSCIATRCPIPRPLAGGDSRAPAHRRRRPHAPARAGCGASSRITRASRLVLTQNGIDALVTSAASGPDLIVLDVYMPEPRRHRSVPPAQAQAGDAPHRRHREYGTLTKSVEENALAAGALTCVRSRWT